MKIWLVLYHNQWAHSECIMDCCCAETTEVVGGGLTKQLAEHHKKVIKNTHMSYAEDKEFEIKEVEILEK